MALQCATAIRYGGFKDYVYGTSSSTLKSLNWPQVALSSSELFKYTTSLPTETRIIPDILSAETDPLFLWQYDGSAKCPAGCRRTKAEDVETGRTCIPGREEDEDVASEVAEEVAKGTVKGIAGFWSAIFKLLKVAAPVDDEL